LEKNMKIKLAKEEKEILDSFEKGECIPVTYLAKGQKAEYTNL